MDDAEKEIQFWKQRASRLRWALVEISLGECDDPRDRAEQALAAERDASIREDR